MRDFLLDEKGDVVIAGDIRYIEDDEVQSLRQVIGTNQGEWWLDENQGIRFPVVLRKKPDPDMILNEVQRALLSVDSRYRVEAFELAVGSDRQARIEFTAKKDDTAVVVAVEI